MFVCCINVTNATNFTNVTKVTHVTNVTSVFPGSQAAFAFAQGVLSQGLRAAEQAAAHDGNVAEAARLASPVAHWTRASVLGIKVTSPRPALKRPQPLAVADGHTVSNAPDLF